MYLVRIKGDHDRVMHVQERIYFDVFSSWLDELCDNPKCVKLSISSSSVKWFIIHIAYHKSAWNDLRIMQRKAIVNL